MAASLASKWSRGVGRSLFGGLGNNLSGLPAGTFHEKGASSTFLSRQQQQQQQQQRRSFIQMGTVLKVADNSGDHNVKAYKVKKGEIVKAVVVRTAMPFSRRDGSVIKIDENAVALLNKHQDYRITKKRNLHKGRRAGRPIGKRVFGPVPYELRKKWLLAVLTLAEDTA
ncbi:50S ribosomal protein HLP [Citrus sinensis]|uniref:50S ribosomal protein HLP n=1 Tax=Citrus sinensis TaxID=2711 RepID=A0ACB8JWL3_CITSI|nr:50S ribosomal protein HLP [Citrus sinensis]